MLRTLVGTFRKQPVTICLCTAAIGTSIWWWSGGQVDLLTMDRRAWSTEPWRLFTSTLPHVNALHLIFNIYWLGKFGGRIEEVLGKVSATFIYILLAVGSSAAEYALFQTGVGLSGICYGLFGMLWVVHSKDSRFADLITPNIVQLFVVWFFVCIAVTIGGVLQVGNVAHGAGAGLGALLGWIRIAESTNQKRIRWSVLSVSLAATLLAASIGRPYVNLSNNVGDELAYLGYLALEKNDFPKAIRLYEQAVKLEPAHGDWWYNLGIAYQQSKSFEDATSAYERAYQLDPHQPALKQTIVGLKLSAAYEKQLAGALPEAIRLYCEAIQLDSTNTIAYVNLSAAYQQVGDWENAVKSMRRVVELEPGNKEYRQLLESMSKANQ